jgi:hypothetical protein
MELEKAWPLYVIVPETFPGNLPARAVKSVVLPLPDGPSIASSSPGRTIPLAPLSTVLVDFGSLEVNQVPFVDKLTLYATSANCKTNLIS